MFFFYDLLIVEQWKLIANLLAIQFDLQYLLKIWQKIRKAYPVFMHVQFFSLTTLK